MLPPRVIGSTPASYVTPPDNITSTPNHLLVPPPRVSTTNPLSDHTMSLKDSAKRHTRSKGPPPSHSYSLRHRTPVGTPFKHRATCQLVAQHIFQPSIHHIYDNSGKKLSLEALLKGSTKPIWSKGLSNEIGRLAQGNDFGVQSTDCMEFIFHHEVPKNKKVTYANFVCDHRPTKPEPWRVRLVVGGR